MKVSKITIENILGIKSLEFDAGQFNEITGDNGVGKTSVVEAIKSVLKGGHDATLLRKGEDVGRTVLLFDNGITVTKEVRADKSKTEVEGTTRPAEYLKRIADLTSVNPVSILLADKKDRLQILLHSIPFNFDWQRLSNIIGIKVNPTDNPLDTIEYWRKKHYDDRTGANKSLKDKLSYISQFERTIPEEPETSLDDTIEGLEGRKMIYGQTRDAKKAEAEKIKSKKTAELNEAHKAAIAKLNEENRAALAIVNSEYSTAVAEADSEYTAAVAPIDADLGAAHQAEKNVAVIQEQQKTLANMKRDAEYCKEESDNFTRIIGEIDELKKELLTDIPITGLDIYDGDIYIDGVEWDRVNESRRTLVAIQIAKLCAGELKLICLDGMEHLSETTYAEFKKHALETDCQFFVSRVESGPLAIANAQVN
jgi:energy-coupling factor transporter ATP-binding protein EcfA2